jgi:hypothetical protein
MVPRSTPLLRQPDRRRKTVFGRVTTPGLPEAKSLRRDDGSGQAVAHPVGRDHAKRRLADLILFQPHQVAALRRPRTEARPRRADNAKGIDQSRPVTEGWAKALLRRAHHLSAPHGAYRLRRDIRATCRNTDEPKSTEARFSLRSFSPIDRATCSSTISTACGRHTAPYGNADRSRP